ncbi:unnamed protein product [Mytilus edulis]|uniref:VLIG-type G domain-containing protein n=1 Tax=Mytilus edulis TaxID=6550 RepID=A0A8S3QRB1_MYTED|nr:unnamed protein product [Mytilus edulis]
MGHPFEVMDGDTANVPLLWVKAVLKTLRESIGDKKAYGIVRFRDTEFWKVDFIERNVWFVVCCWHRTLHTRCLYATCTSFRQHKLDYVLVIDAEGLSSTTSTYKSAVMTMNTTFVVGLGDVAIVNVKGENTEEVQDVLQIVVHAFLRLKLANERLNLKPKCVFVHQNVSAPDNEKLTQQRTSFNNFRGCNDASGSKGIKYWKR